ncbi:MAG: NAD(P)-dependent oxidoreductase [Actinomycetota bacterium]|nr:NAD(P)-dependent oxidoreductase [Actinomycetota bacterium]
MVVTGGLGFIGSHVADAFLARGHEVSIIDSMVASVTEGEEFENHSRCTVVRRSIEDYVASGGDFEGAERVIHAAAHVGPAGILQYRGKLGADIVRSTEAVIDGCVAADVPLCVFSSAEVYGRSGMLGEKDDIRVPTGYNARIEYAVAKTLTEAMTINSAARGLRPIVIRPFNVAGSRQSRAGGFVMPTFVQQALTGQAITVFATGDQVRAFTAASDLSRFLTNYMDQALASDNVIFNIGNPANATTIRDLAERVKRLLGSPSEVVHTDARSIHGPAYAEAESFEKVPALDAATALGWSPEIDLDALIMQTAGYYMMHGDRRADALS